jgi:hypothetical protein
MGPILICVSTDIFNNCPHLEPSKECEETKVAIDECGKEGSFEIFMTRMMSNFLKSIDKKPNTSKNTAGKTTASKTSRTTTPDQ